mmetsp:Transcript_80898/g.203498  ORF Transcript_80898/g.203498 Transcript_80898/m.203498 type:complete len:212 (+) Transcript_80898:55-690(+)
MPASRLTPRLHKKQSASAAACCAILVLAAAGALVWTGSSLGFSTGTGGSGRRRSNLRQQQQPQQQQQQQQIRVDPEQPSSFVELRGVGGQMESGVSEEQLAAVWRLPEKQGSPGELEQEPPAKHAFWARQKATPVHDQAEQRSALRLPGLHEQVKRALRFHEDRLAREKAANEDFDPDNADHVATLLYRIFTVFVLWAGAMNAMSVWEPTL